MRRKECCGVSEGQPTSACVSHKRRVGDEDVTDDVDGPPEGGRVPDLGLHCAIPGLTPTCPVHALVRQSGRVSALAEHLGVAADELPLFPTIVGVSRSVGSGGHDLTTGRIDRENLQTLLRLWRNMIQSLYGCSI